MQFVTGMIVRSKQGHDKGQFYVVLTLNGRIAEVSNARSRTAASPKRKNCCHLAPTRTVLTAQQLDSDSEIQKVLAAFSERAAFPKEVI